MKKDSLPDIPEELMKKIGKEKSGEASTDLSKFRTRMSEHRTEMSEHRTGLSEHRTDLSEHRTGLSEHRTDLSEKRTKMSEHRTSLSDVRSHLANERTHLAHLRTAASLMSLGITMNKFSSYLQQSDRMPSSAGHGLSGLRDIENVGLGMVILGILILAGSLYRYRVVYKQIETLSFKPPGASVTVFTVFVMLVASFSIIWMMIG